MGCCYSSNANKDSIDSIECQEDIKIGNMSPEKEDTAATRINDKHVYLDITKDGILVGRLTIRLFHDVPRTSHNFLSLCSGIFGYGFKGSKFHRIIPGFMCQGGDFTHHNGTGGRSIYGSKFKDENFFYKHTHRGILSMANSGPNTNGSQFFICFRAANWLDGKHVVFGEVEEGLPVLDVLESCGTNSGKPTNTLLIIDCGEITSRLRLGSK